MNSSEIMYALTLVIIAQAVVLALFVNIAVLTNNEPEEQAEFLNTFSTDNINHSI